MEKIQNKSLDRRNNNILKNTIGALLITFSLSTEVKADFATNMITNPAYSFFPGNIFHNIIWDDEVYKNPKFKKTVKESEKILGKYIKDKEKIKKLNIEYLKLISKLYNKKEKIDPIIFFDNFLKIGEENNLTIQQNMDILKMYVKRGFINDDYLKKFRKEIGLKLKGLLNFYEKEQFYSKMKKLDYLYQKNGLTKEKIKEIFKDYLKKAEKIDEILTYLVGISFIVFIGVGINLFRD